MILFVGKTVENKGKLILIEIFPSVQKHDIKLFDGKTVENKGKLIPRGLYSVGCNSRVRE